MKTIYAGIDIGTYSIKFVVGEYFNHKFYVLASHSVKSKGIKKGLIVEPNLVIDSIKEGISEINEMLGVEIKKVIVNVPSYNAKFMYVTSEVDVEEIITTENINIAIKTSVYN